MQIVLRHRTIISKEKLTRISARFCKDTLWKKRTTLIPSSTTDTIKRIKKKKTGIAGGGLSSPKHTEWFFSKISKRVQLGFILSQSLHTGDKAGWASVRASVLLLSFPVCTYLHNVCTIVHVHVWMDQQAKDPIGGKRWQWWIGLSSRSLSLSLLFISYLWQFSIKLELEPKMLQLEIITS